MHGLNIPSRPTMLATLLLGASLGANAGILTNTGGEITTVVAGKNQSNRYAYDGVDGNLVLAADPAGTGKSVMRISLHDQTQGISQRTEVTPWGEYIRDGKRWYAFSVYFPNWGSTLDLNVFQLHTSQSISGWHVSPPLALLASKGDLQLRTNSSHLRPSANGDRTVPSNDSKNLEQQIIRLQQIKPNAWYCGVVMVDWNVNAGQGATNFWLNNKLVYSSSNVANTYESQHDPVLYPSGGGLELGNYPKAGLYAPGYMDPDDATVYHGFVYIGTNANTDGTVTTDTDMRKLMAQKTMCPM